MTCRLTIDLSPLLSPALLPPEVYAELYRSYVSAYRSLGFALLGQNSPKARPASPQTPPPTPARTPRNSKPAQVPRADNTPRGPSRVQREAHRDLTPASQPASYVAAAASPSPSPLFDTPTRRSVKVSAPVSTPQPKLDLVTPTQLLTPARASAMPLFGSSALSIPDLASEFDSEMQDSAIEMAPILNAAPPKPFPVPTWEGKDPSRTFGHTIITSDPPPKEGTGWEVPLVMYRIDDPEVDALMKKIENAALPFPKEERRVHNSKLSFNLQAEITLQDVLVKQFGAAPKGSVYLIPASKRTLARLRGCDLLASPSLYTIRFPSGAIFWVWQGNATEVWRLQKEYQVTVHPPIPVSATPVF